MGRPKRNILAAAEESTTPPDEVSEAQSVARVGKPEGNNLYTCILPNTKTVLVELAQRFRKTIWIKRGGFVLVDLTPSEERSKANSRVQGEIINVVRDEKEWRKMSYWYVREMIDSLDNQCLTSVNENRPREFPKHTYDDADDRDMNPRDLPPSDSEDEV
ncbi:protein G6G8.9 [Cryphonectria parasitica EP155]|uniref:Protein G6G8.9 n=1 Tax=Cryphonectria parasitica (strain ATCC 38755 / EP155) TaxID=660469 RepID=A0A9P4Y528_CRYP1|nr:protein G6G8.9 [Cryphonectria parasitica EP155]KAF3767109.1 protein G6G8.9 [Cryphonectria parasitica EP155]